jgi:drug/metabolite transporter (DMT)-like permease
MYELIMNNFILFGITLFCWSPTWYVIKLQLGYVDPLVSVFYRFIVASIIIFIYLLIKKKNLKFSLDHHIWFLFFGTCLYSLNYVFFYLSNTYLISAFPAIVFSTVVIMNILGEAFYFKKRPSFKTLIGATTGMIGIIIIFSDEIFNFNLSNGTHVGLFLALLGTFCASTGNMIHQRNLNNNFPLIETIAYAMLYGSFITLLITQINGTELLFEYSFSYIASLAYLSIVGSIFAFIFYLRLLEKVGAGRAGYVGVVMPVLALLISTIFENLELQIDLIVGLPILIIGAILVINQKIKPVK